MKELLFNYCVNNFAGFHTKVNPNHTMIVVDEQPINFIIKDDRVTLIFELDGKTNRYVIRQNEIGTYILGSYMFLVLGNAINHLLNPIL
jgi:hypothetical protein